MPHTGFKFDGSEAPHFPDVVRLQSLVAARLKSTDVASQVRGGRKKRRNGVSGRLPCIRPPFPTLAVASPNGQPVPPPPLFQIRSQFLPLG